MKLTQDQQDLLDGKFGEGAKLAMKSRLRLANLLVRNEWSLLLEPRSAK